MTRSVHWKYQLQLIIQFKKLIQAHIKFSDSLLIILNTEKLMGARWNGLKTVSTKMFGLSTDETSFLLCACP
jgi:hypothetical protein